MNMQEAFDRGDFLRIVESRAEAASPEDKLLVGISLFKLGKSTDAMKVFLEISELVSDLARVFYYMALINKEKGNMDSARFCLEQYMPFYPDDDEALEILESGEQTPQLMSEPSLELAKIYASQGHFEQAMDIYSHLIKDPAHDPEVYRDARRVETMHIIRTLEGWLERMKK